LKLDFARSEATKQTVDLKRKLFDEEYMTKEYQHISKTSIWKGIALVAGIFSFVICVLIIANFFQINRADPVNTEIMNALVERLNQDPTDNLLREEIRALDLLARKAYFTSQWQIRIGGYMLLIGIAVIVIAMQMLISEEKKKVLLNPQKDADLLRTQSQSRKWISVFSIAIVMITVVLAFLSHQELGKKFTQAALANSEQVDVADEVPSAIKSKGSNADIDGESNEETIQETSKTNIPEQVDVVTDEITPENNHTGTEKNLTIIKEENNTEDIQADNKSTENTKEVASPPSEKSIESFTTFRGPGSNGITVQKNVPTQWNGETGENVLWKTKIPLSGFNSPIIWGDKLFLSGATSEKFEVYCINRHSGEFLWTSELKDVPGSPDKAPKVESYTGYAAGTMATDGTYVFCIFANGDIGAFNMEGEQVWARNLGSIDNHYGYASSLVVYEDKVIVQYDQRNMQKVFALDTKTGEIAWEKPRDVKISWASPVLVETHRGAEVILAADPLVISYNPENGEEWWRIKCLSGEVGPSIAYANGIVFAMNEYASLVAIDITDKPKLLWENYDFLSDVPSPVATDEYLFIPVSWAMLACYEPKTGEILWEYEFDNSIYASPIISEDKVYLMDKKGVMHIFKVADEYISVGDPELGEGSVCTPAFANGRIYIRGLEHLYCIEKELE
jgi:outer membrane protein assembly factor BamB